MRSFSTSCSAKTFLLGEYSVLTSRRALLLLTNPQFSAEFEEGEGGIIPDHCLKFVENRAPFLKNFSYKFHDPYYGIGGLGASSAEFLFYLRAASYFGGLSYDVSSQGYRDLCLSYFIESCWSGVGVRPSGIDLISQDYSGIVFVDFDSAEVCSLDWPFDNFGFALVHTGKKLATHKHLESVSSLPDLSCAENGVLSAWRALGSRDFYSLARAVNEAAFIMNKNGFVASHTLDLLDLANSTNIFSAAKGCGAMGADVVLFLYDKDFYKGALKFFYDNNLKVLATEQSLLSKVGGFV